MYIFTILILLLSQSAFSQSLHIFDIDTTDFPTMKAKFYAFDEDGEQVTPNLNDIKIFENDEERQVLSIDCPAKNEVINLSSVLVIDVSGSMSGGNLELAKAGASAYVNLLNTESEIALTAFSSSNFLVQDFTSDRTLLKSKINSLSAGGGTSFDAALFNEKAGGLKIIQNRTNKKSIVLLTDGQSSLSNKQEIIDEANRMGCAINIVTLNMKCPQVLKDVANGTGGLFFENVTDTKEIEEIYNFLFLVTSKIQECEISWKSSVNCNSGNVELKTRWKNTENINEYKKSFNSTADLEISPKFVYFKNPQIGTKIDTTITLKAINSDITLIDILNKNSNALFSIEPQNFPMTLNEGVEYRFTLSFTPTDSNMNYVILDFITDLCNKSMSSIAGFVNKPFTMPTLKLTSPNGGEVFVAGSDTVITWEGIAEDDNVALELSTNNGNTWNLIDRNAKGLKYDWNIPKISSEECLVRVTQIGDDDKNFDNWSKSFGGSNDDFLISTILTSKNELIVSGTTKSFDYDVDDFKGKYDFWILKLSIITGEIIWKKNYGGIRSDVAISSFENDDNTITIIGHTDSEDIDFINNVGSYDIILLTVNLDDGQIINQKKYGGEEVEYVHKAIRDNEGNFILTGHSNSKNGIFQGNKGKSDLYVMKISHINGSIIWNKTFGGSEYDFGNSLIQTNDSNIVVVGYTRSNDNDINIYKGEYDYFILKISHEDGSIIWNKTFGGSGNDIAYDIIETYDNNLVVVGRSTSIDGDIKKNNGDSDYWILKLNTFDGNIITQNSFGGSSRDIPSSVVELNDNSLVILGHSNSYDKDVSNNIGELDFWLININDNLESIIWQKNIGGSDEDKSSSILMLNDNSFIVSGDSKSSDFDVLSNNGGFDYFIYKFYNGEFYQKDSSNAVFSIVMPETGANDIDMGECLVSDAKDSVVNEFVLNTGTYKYNVDSVYFQGADADAFELISGIPKYEVAANSDAYGEFRFTPIRVGQHSATIVIITQVDTLNKNISGIGVEPTLEIVNNFIDFGAIYVGESKDTNNVVTIKNISNSPIEITNIYHSFPNDRDFTTLAGNGVITLEPDEEHPMNLRFTASEVGLTNGTLLFEYDGVGSPAMVQLYGEGLFFGTSYAEFSGIKISGYAGDEIEFPIILTFEEDLDKTKAKSLKFDLYFNPTLLHPIDYEPIIYSHYKAKIELEITDFDIDLNEIVKYVQFDVGLGNSPKCDIILENPRVDDDKLDVTFQNGEFELLGICYEGGARLVNPNWYVSIVYISPNPAENTLEIMLNLIEEGKTELAIYSTSGDKVKVIFNEEIANTGEQIINADISDLPSGTYIVVLVTPTYSERKNLVIQR